MLRILKFTKLFFKNRQQGLQEQQEQQEDYKVLHIVTDIKVLHIVTDIKVLHIVTDIKVLQGTTYSH